MYPLFIVDAFTKRAFKGNGAAICLLSYKQELSKETKQSIAAEMKLSETAFISVINETDSFEKGKRFGLQWFSPTCEVTLCGHATLASAATLFFVYNNVSEILEFETVSGVLTAKRLPDGKIQIDLPAYQSKPVGDKYKEVIKVTVGELPVQEIVISESKKLLVRLHDSVTRQTLEQFRPVGAEMMAAASDLKGVIVTLKGSGMDDCIDENGNSYDFISRYFAPWLGVPEDPVTGSAHSVLGPYWSKVLKKEKLYARQCSQRGGDLQVEVVGNRVNISGNAVVVVKGQIQF